MSERKLTGIKRVFLFYLFHIAAASAAYRTFGFETLIVLKLKARQGILVYYW